MRRRTVLASLVSLGFGGCLTGSPPVASPPSTDTPSATTTGTAPTTITETAPTEVDATLTPREQCAAPGDATVDVDGTTVWVTGCVRGANGCHAVELVSSTWDSASRQLSVVVASVDRQRGDMGCTQALVDLGYELTARTPEPPTRVRVVHDDVDGRQTVAQG